jgi:hypothetical protein
LLLLLLLLLLLHHCCQSGTESLAQDASGNVKMSFVMPSKYTRETLPRPNNPDVNIVEVRQGAE